MLKNMFSRKDQEEKVRKEGRLPPGQSLTQKFPVLHYGPVPRFDPATWTKITMDIHCVTRWSKFETNWEGVSLKTLLDEGLLKLKPSARYTVQHAEYGYTTNLPLDVVLQENFLLATHFDGQPLPPDHGYPLRGVVGAIPGRNDLKEPYLWKGAKWIRGIEFTTDDHPGFWEQAGYHNDGDVWQEQRFRRMGW
jgi:DMSO/TMAO reductase YedYZ molybdopterin-dependent catalytic subunit